MTTEREDWITAELQIDDEWHDAYLTTTDDIDDIPRECRARPVVIQDAEENEPDEYAVELEVRDENGDAFSIVLDPAEARAIAAQLLRGAFACQQVDPQADVVTLADTGVRGEA